VGQSSPQSGGEGQSSSKAFAAEYVTRMLAELRALGEGIAIIDQLPTAVSSEVIKNTGTKLSLRQVSEDDRELLGSTMLLDTQQVQELARLRVGEGFFYNEKLHSPRRVRCLNAYEYLNLSAEMYPDSKVITGILYQDEWFQEVLRDQLVYISKMYKSFVRDITVMATRVEAIQRRVTGFEQLAEVEYQDLQDYYSKRVLNFIEESEKEFGLAKKEDVYSISQARVKDWDEELSTIISETKDQDFLEIYRIEILSLLDELEKKYNSIEKDHTDVAVRVVDWGGEASKEMLETLNEVFEESVVDQIGRFTDFCYEVIDQIEERRI